MLNECGLSQLINFPTRQNNRLDILLTNNKSLLTSLIDVPGISNHTRIPLADTLCHPSGQKINKRTVHLWNRANLPDIKETLVRDVKRILRLSPEQSVSYQLPMDRTKDYI